jgi:hypothetical protein
MGTSTRRPGPRTGLVTPKCYAAALGNCDGNPTTKSNFFASDDLGPTARVAAHVSGEGFLRASAAASALTTAR